MLQWVKESHTAARTHTATHTHTHTHTQTHCLTHAQGLRHETARHSGVPCESTRAGWEDTSAAAEEEILEGLGPSANVLPSWEIKTYIEKIYFSI